MKSLPSFHTYCPNTTAANALSFRRIGTLDIFYSYKTPIAFRGPQGLVVRKNSWGPTTGKHLNAVDGGTAAAKKSRMSGEAFEAALALALEGEV